MTPAPFRTRRARAWLVGLGLTLAGCGGGDFAELFVKLITARFVPNTLSIAQAGTQMVDLELSCDRAGLDTPFGRLGVRVKLDPSGTLASGVTARLVNGVADAGGFTLYPCTGATADPDLRMAHIPVQVAATAAATPGTTTLVAFIEVEPLIAGEPSKDSTQTQLAITVTSAGPPAFGSNLLVNPSFEEPVTLGTLPTAPGNWRGDLSASVPAEMGIAPHGGASMLKFQATGAVASTNTLTSQQWQLVDLSGFAAAIAAGGVRADASAWFNRVTGGELTDRRFDLRVLAFDGSPADLPARYVASDWLAEQTAPLISTANHWQQVNASLTLPPGTRYLLVEIYASEDSHNDGESAEFDGHFADDISLVLMQQVL